MFRSGAFVDCIMDFVVFQSCEFEGTEAKPFDFEGVRASGLTLHGGSAQQWRFKNCELYKMWWFESE